MHSSKLSMAVDIKCTRSWYYFTIFVKGDIKTFNLSELNQVFFSVHCTLRVSLFITWLLLRNSPYKCQLVYSVQMYSLSGTSDFLCYVCTLKTDLHWLTPGFLSMILSSDQRITSPVLNYGQFSRGPHLWWNSTINQLLSPCRTVGAGEKLPLNIRKLGSWLFIRCRLWMIMILNHSSSGLNPNPLPLLQLPILMNRFFTPWTPAELPELPF